MFSKIKIIRKGEEEDRPLKKNTIKLVIHTVKKKISVDISCKRARVSRFSNLHHLGPIFYFSVHLHLMMNEDDKFVDEAVFLVMVLEIHKQESL